MTPLDAAVVRRKLRRIRANLSLLTTAADATGAGASVADELHRRAIERLLQETVDAAVDVNNLLLRGTGAPPAEDYYSSFVELGRAGIIAPALAESLAPATGLRNRIVHEYEELDDALVLDAARQAPREFGEYLAAVEHYLASAGL